MMMISTKLLKSNQKFQKWKTFPFLRHVHHSIQAKLPASIKIVKNKPIFEISILKSHRGRNFGTEGESNTWYQFGKLLAENWYFRRFLRTVQVGILTYLVFYSFSKNFRHVMLCILHT